MIAAITLLAALATALNGTEPVAGRAEPCASATRAEVVVRTEDRVLYLCAGGKVVRTFGVRLGRGGVGKTAEGDKKVPLGRYALGRPRSSKRYGLFIPIGYPTPAQRRQGQSGGGVGIHGPDRRVRWLGRLVNVFDTTDGCIGVATDKEMDELAGWVKRIRPGGIDIR